MRIVGGKFKDRQLTSPADKRVRPTAEHVRDSVMRVLARDLEGARVLDLFAGTGALGLEAMSRGAKYADFVESRPASLHALKANIAALRVRERSRVFKKDAIPFAALLEPNAYDIAFADPPYGSAMLDRIIESWRVSPFARILVVEHEATHKLPAGGKTHVFQDTVMTVFRARKNSLSVSGSGSRSNARKHPGRRAGTAGTKSTAASETVSETEPGKNRRKRPPKAVREAERELKRKPSAAKGAAKKDAGERPRRLGQRQDRNKPTGVGRKRVKTGSKPRVRE